MSLKPRIIVSALVIVALYVSSLRAAAPADIVQYLLQVAKFSQTDITTLENGAVIARIMPGSSDSEVMVVAAVKIRASRDQTVNYYGQMISYVDGKVTTAFGRFSNPPSLGDVKDLSFDANEVAHLRSCKAGECDLRIGGTALEAIRSSVDWNAPDIEARVNARIREAIVAYAGAYMKSGDEALITYNDRLQPVSLKREWLGILAASPYFQQYAPPLRDHLAEYPRRPAAGARDILYWVNEKYTGLKPVMSVVHAVIYQDPTKPDRTMVAQKQLYASHYYDGSLAIASATAARDGSVPVTYLVYANRSRGDLLKGGFGGLRRKVAGDQAKNAAEQTLGTIKTVLESMPAR
jgi:hypothetical protein